MLARLAFLLALIGLIGVGSAANSAPAHAGGVEGAISRCQDMVRAFEKAPQSITIETKGGGVDETTAVRIDWQGGRGGKDGWIVCWFPPRQETGGAWQLQQLDTSEFGTMSRYEIQQLYKLLHLEELVPEQKPPETNETNETRTLYFVQQAINAVSLGCVYALIALGYTLVYGITRAINFAFGEVYMLGAFFILLGNAVVLYLAGQSGTGALLLVMVAGLAVSAAYGWAMDSAVFQPLRRAPSTVPLIAAIGLSIAMKESVRLLQGAKTRYLLVEQLRSWPILTGQGFDLYVNEGHVMVGIATAILLAVLWWLSMRTRFGRHQRACAQDPRMAAMLGVDVDRTIAATFMIGGALAGAAGLFAGAQYGVINFHMGTLMGFKALTAALLGGIGSLPGAVLGGMLIAFTESFTAALVGEAWKDLAVFVVLVLVLLVRPGGLLGTLTTVSADERA
ncbi:MAG: branched-chain amino acid ABC transporter permease [Pseudomonadota bacterium]